MKDSLCFIIWAIGARFALGAVRSIQKISRVRIDPEDLDSSLKVQYKLP